MVSFSRAPTALALFRFRGSAWYWEWRYASGGNSGAGSYGAEAAYKTAFLAKILKSRKISSVIDFGCGDGNQLRDLEIPSYRGFDVSRTAIECCRSMYAGDASKTFHHIDAYRNESADAALSLDVLYHLIEDDVFQNYLDRLFHAANRVVVIYAVDAKETRSFRGRHVRFRKFTDTIARRYPDFHLTDAPPRPDHLLDSAETPGASFFVYERIA